MAQTTLQWHPKRFAEGDMAGEAALRILGRPRLGRVATLVRETAQNSWDARLSHGGVVDFTISLRRLEGPSLTCLRRRVFLEPGDGIEMAAALRKRSVRVLEIADRGTSGLSGPVRVDEPVEDGQPTNFRDFVFALGATRDTGANGGTYGFGKVISYLMSEVRTVLIWSHCAGPNGVESRLIGSAMGSEFVRPDDSTGQLRQYTGRQWWGVRTPDRRVEPLCGAPADEIAGELFETGFASGETGTSLLLIAPNLSDGDDALHDLSEAVLTNLWPKLVPAKSNGSPSMRCALRANGEEIPLPDPVSHPFFGGFVRSLQAVRWEQSKPRARVGAKATPPFTSVEAITRYGKAVGHLAVTKQPVVGSRDVPETFAGSDAVHHVALMRHDTELVVEYLQLPAPPLPNWDCAGVFRSVQACDPAFAEAEPPAHDTWEPTSVDDPVKQSIVRVALNKIPQSWEAHVGLTSIDSGEAADAAVDGTGRLARHLGFLVDGVEGMGGGPQSKRTKLPPPPPGPRVGLGEPRLRELPGTSRVQVTVPFELLDATVTHRVEASVGVGFDGGTDTDVGGTIDLVGFAPQSAQASDSAGDLIPARTVEIAPGETWLLLVEADQSVAVDIAVQIADTAESDAASGQG